MWPTIRFWICIVGALFNIGMMSAAGPGFADVFALAAVSFALGAILSYYDPRNS